MVRIKERALLKKTLRGFFDARDYLEVDTPVLVSQPGVEVHIDYFKTQYHDYHGRVFSGYLRSSPELAMKKLVLEGYERIYQLGPAFREGGEHTPWHHPEFSLAEWYGPHESLQSLKLETKELCEAVYGAFHRSLPPLTELSVYEAFWEFLGIELKDEDPHLGEQGLAKGLLSPRREDDFETAFFKIMLEGIEPQIKKLQWVFLDDYPPSQAILSEVKENRAQRFEAYLHGVELCNGFLECLDHGENLARMKLVNEKRQALGKEVLPLNASFYQALQKPHGRVGGNALGIDRLLALVCGLLSIDSVIVERQGGVFPD